MEAKILDLQHWASACKCGTDCLWIVGEDPIAPIVLSLHNRPRLRRVLEPPKPGPVDQVLVRFLTTPVSVVASLSLNSNYFALAPCRMDGEPHDVAHGYARAALFFLAEVIRKSLELVLRRSVESLLRFCHELFGFHDLTGVI